MALLPIVQYPDPRLAQKAVPVEQFDEKLAKLAADMAETMYAAPGVGLAEPAHGNHGGCAYDAHGAGGEHPVRVLVRLPGQEVDGSRV